MASLLYLLLFALTLAFGLGVVVARRADYQAFSLMAAMFCLAVNWMMLGITFLGLLQVVVYVGAIMVIFLFVIMLLNLRHPEPLGLRGQPPARLLGMAASAFFFLVVTLYAVGTVDWRGALPAAVVERPGGKPLAQPGAVEVARELVTTWLYPFEIISLLLLAAVVAAIMIARTRPVIQLEADLPAGDAAPAAATAPAPAAAPSSHHA